jgi:2-C-methyl-D-erythritol 4-phosphate cytidylyltransferase/2-C-methyl-D-erythritol 2,4-cyclodiphosphate synthase
VTDEAALAEQAGHLVQLVESDPKNLKITTPGDLAHAEMWLRAETSNVRMGIGYDSHRLVEGESLVLGGVEIEHEKGLEGHSDADVLIHAVIDALLGACGLGDLGTLFPPSEEQWRDADSMDLLGIVVGRISGRAVNVDATVICEEPKLAPYRAEMEAKLAGALSAPVSVKATTNEGMGAIGRGEGIACMAVAAVETD